jgi:hypothetical protein
VIEKSAAFSYIGSIILSSLLMCIYNNLLTIINLMSNVSLDFEASQFAVQLTTTAIILTRGAGVA